MARTAQAIQTQERNQEQQAVNANDYQQEVMRTFPPKPYSFTDEESKIIWCAMGLAGEAGEASEVIKKGIFHQHGLDRQKLLEELGDCLWYIAALCNRLNVPIEAVMQRNLDKLRLRYPNGFTPEDSKRRVDVDLYSHDE